MRCFSQLSKVVLSAAFMLFKFLFANPNSNSSYGFAISRKPLKLLLVKSPLHKNFSADFLLVIASAYLLSAIQLWKVDGAGKSLSFKDGVIRLGSNPILSICRYSAVSKMD